MRCEKCDGWRCRNCGITNEELYGCRGVSGELCRCKTMGPGLYMNYFGKNHGPGPMNPRPPPPSGWVARNP